MIPYFQIWADEEVTWMPQIYLQLGGVAILHRTNELTQPRWRRDGVYKFILGSRGSISFETAQSSLKVRSDQFVLFNPGEKHQQVGCDGDKFLLEFSPNIVNAVTGEMMGSGATDVHFANTPRYNRELVALANDLLPELYDSRPGQRLVLEHAALQLLVLTIRSIHSHDLARSGKLDTTGVQKAVSMMTECYAEPLSLEGIATFADMSEFSLIRQFREAVGTTPYEWLQQYRLSRVKEDLLKTRRTVTDVALEHGFSSVSAANRLFRRLYGMSPGQWRQLYQEDIDARNEDDADSGDVE